MHWASSRFVPHLLLGLTQNQAAWVFYLHSHHGYSPKCLWKPRASASSAALTHLWQRCPDLMDRYEARQLLPSVSAHSAPHPLISLFCLWFPPDWLSVDETRNEMDELHGNTSVFWLSSGGELSEPGDIVEISPWISKQKQIAGNVSPDISFSKISFGLSNWENVAWIVTVDDLFQIGIFFFLSSRNLNYRLGIRSRTNLWGNLMASSSSSNQNELEIWLPSLQGRPLSMVLNDLQHPFQPNTFCDFVISLKMRREINHYGYKPVRLETATPCSCSANGRGWVQVSLYAAGDYGDALSPESCLLLYQSLKKSQV